MRIIALDGIRGILLVIMTIDHLGGQYLTRLTLEPLGFVSAAEGFVLLSGIVWGMIYSDRNSLFKNTQSRLAYIYKHHVIIGIIVMAILTIKPYTCSGEICNLYNTTNYIESPLKTFISISTLLYYPPYTDILSLYIVCIALSYPYIKLMRKGKTHIAILISATLWILSKYVDAWHIKDIYKIAFNPLDLYLGFFDALAWQFLFTIGIAIGKNRVSLTESINKNTNKASILILITTTITLIILSKTDILSVNNYNNTFDRMLLDSKQTLSILRIVNTLLITTLFYHFRRYLKYIFEIPILITLGKNSIQVFCAHIILTITISDFVTLNRESIFAETIAAAFSITVLFCVAKINTLRSSSKKLQSIKRQ